MTLQSPWVSCKKGYFCGNTCGNMQRSRRKKVYASVQFYGMHWMLNVVTEAEGFPAAVLLRTIVATEGVEMMQQRRGRTEHLTDGPAKIAQALALDKRWNGTNLCASEADIFIEKAKPVLNAQIATSPRVGLGKTPEPWLSKPWNFSLVGVDPKF